MMAWEINAIPQYESNNDKGKYYESWLQIPGSP
jgi:hypothetical protein